jgi:hypothetical protein
MSAKIQPFYGTSALSRTEEQHYDSSSISNELRSLVNKELGNDQLRTSTTSSSSFTLQNNTSDRDRYMKAIERIQLSLNDFKSKTHSEFSSSSSATIGSNDHPLVDGTVSSSGGIIIPYNSLKFDGGSGRAADNYESGIITLKGIDRRDHGDGETVNSSGSDGSSHAAAAVRKLSHFGNNGMVSVDTNNTNKSSPPAPLKSMKSSPNIRERTRTRRSSFTDSLFQPRERRKTRQEREVEAEDLTNRGSFANYSTLANQKEKYTKAVLRFKRMVNKMYRIGGVISDEDIEEFVANQVAHGLTKEEGRKLTLTLVRTYIDLNKGIDQVSNSSSWGGRGA